MKHTLELWEHPGSYFGFNPTEDYLLYAKHRESDTITESNYRCIERDVLKLAAAHPFDMPEERMPDSFPSRGGISPRSAGWIYTWKAGSSMVGWIEYMMIRGDAPEAIIDKGHHIMADLSGYPIYDEDDWSELECRQVYEYWASESIRGRMHRLQEAGDSVFAARRKNSIPERTFYMMRDTWQ